MSLMAIVLDPPIRPGKVTSQRGSWGRLGPAAPTARFAPSSDLNGARLQDLPLVRLVRSFSSTARVVRCSTDGMSSSAEASNAATRRWAAVSAARLASVSPVGLDCRPRRATTRSTRPSAVSLSSWYCTLCRVMESSRARAWPDGPGLALMAASSAQLDSVSFDGKIVVGGPAHRCLRFVQAAPEGLGLSAAGRSGSIRLRIDGREAVRESSRASPLTSSLRRSTGGRSVGLRRRPVRVHVTVARARARARWRRAP